MTLEDIENYVKVLEINPKSKYVLIISKHSGLPMSEIAQIKLHENFVDNILVVNGRPDDVIASVPLTKN